MIITYTPQSYMSAGYVGSSESNAGFLSVPDSATGVFCIFVMSSGSLNMDKMDTLYPLLDDIPYNLDSSYYEAEDFVLAGIPDSVFKKVKTYTGAATQGELETGEISTGTGGIIRLQKVRPRIQSYSSTTTVKGLARFNENVDTDVQTSDVALSNGEASLRATGRYLRINLKTDIHSGIPNEIEADITGTGKR